MSPYKDPEVARIAGAQPGYLDRIDVFYRQVRRLNHRGPLPVELEEVA